MPITEHIVQCPTLHRFGTSNDLILQASSLSQCVALTEQFAMLSVHANDIFSSLFQEASGILERISTLSDKVSRIAAKVDSINDETLAALKPVKNHDSGSANMNFLFKPDSLPSCLQQRLEQARTMPDFSLLDEFDDNKKCSSKYSYPEFFIEQWVINERQRQKDVELQRQKKKEERRARRKNERPGKGAADGEKSGRIAVNAVKKKQYHVLGQEFAGTDVGALPNKSHSVSTETPAYVQEPPNEGQRMHEEGVPEPEALDTNQEYLNEQVATPFVPPAAPPCPSAAKVPPAPPPPPAPPLPTPSALPTAAPSASVPPPPPPLPLQETPIPSPANPGQDRSQLLASIQQGMKLKPALRENVSAKPTNNRENLLAQIREGSKLRSTPKAADGTPKKSDDAYSEIKALLDRRQFLIPVDSDHSVGEDDDSDSDDWKD